MKEFLERLYAAMNLLLVGSLVSLFVPIQHTKVIALAVRKAQQICIMAFRTIAYISAPP